MDVKVTKHHLVSTFHHNGVKVGGVVPGGRRTQGDIHVDESQCGSPEVCLDCQNFCRVVIEEYVIIKHPVGDGVVYESDKSTASGRAIAPDGDIACELLQGGIQAEFGVLHTGDHHLVMVKEVLQFCVAVLNVIAVELQKPASEGGRSWSGSLGK